MNVIAISVYNRKSTISEIGVSKGNIYFFARNNCSISFKMHARFYISINFSDEGYLICFAYDICKPVVSL